MHQLRHMHGTIFEKNTAKFHAPEIIHKTQHAARCADRNKAKRLGANNPNLPHFEANGGLKRNRSHHHRYICHVVSQILLTMRRWVLGAHPINVVSRHLADLLGRP